MKVEFKKVRNLVLVPKNGFCLTRNKVAVVVDDKIVGGITYANKSHYALDSLHSLQVVFGGERFVKVDSDIDKLKNFAIEFLSGAIAANAA